MKTRFQNSDLYFLQDERLSLGAKGLLMYLIVNPEERYVSKDNWVIDSRNTCSEVESMLEELIKATYIRVEQHKLNILLYSTEGITIKGE